MAKNENKTVTTPGTATTPETQQLPRLPFTATVGYAQYTDRDKAKHEYIKITLNNPFPAEDFNEIEMACKWRQDKGVFDFKAKKALVMTDELTMTGYFTVDSFVSKQSKKRIRCVSVRANNPFFSGEFDLKLRNPEDSAVLAMLLSDLWGIKLSRYADEALLATADDPAGV